MTAAGQIRAPRRSSADGPRPALAPSALAGTRWMSIVRAGYGVALLAVPGQLLTTVTGCSVSSRVRVVARVLGARQLAQATICGLAPTSGLIRAGAAADGLHAASMLALAGMEAGLRRALLADAAIGGAFASAAAAAFVADRYRYR